MISVVVIVYNAIEYLHRCLDSVLGSSYADLEVVCVDDASTDGSLSLLREYQEWDKRVRIIRHERNLGLGAARKTGIEAALGEYIAFVDSDDYIEPEMYDMLAKRMQGDVDLVESGHYSHYGSLHVRELPEYEEGLHQGSCIVENMLCDEGFHECRLKSTLWSKLFKSEMLKAVISSNRGYECIGYGEDSALVYTYARRCKSLYFSHYCGYHYVRRLESKTNKLTDYELDSCRRMLEFMYRDFAGSAGMIKQLNRYAKSVLLLRVIDYYDNLLEAGLAGKKHGVMEAIEEGAHKEARYAEAIGVEAKCTEAIRVGSAKEELLLGAYGGISDKAGFVVYGAGKMGKTIYDYLTKKGVHVEGWYDRNFRLFREIGQPVDDPAKLQNVDSGSKIIVAVSGREKAESIKQDLICRGFDPAIIIWVDEKIISDEYDVLRELGITMGKRQDVSCSAM